MFVGLVATICATLRTPLVRWDVFQPRPEFKIKMNATIRQMAARRANFNSRFRANGALDCVSAISSECNETA